MKFIKSVKFIVLFLVLLCNASILFAGDLRLLLITKSDYKPLAFTKNELRRLFLGVPVYRNGEALVPLINKSEDLCYQVFLQTTLGMSQKRYERSLVSGIYRQGVKSPNVYTDFNKLLRDLNKNAKTISFYYDHGKPISNEFNVVQEIWKSNEQ